LDNEDNQNCVEMLNDFYNVMHEYQKDHQDKGAKDSTGYLQGWGDKIDRPDDIQQKFLNVKWRKYKCTPGEARFGLTRPAMRTDELCRLGT